MTKQNYQAAAIVLLLFFTSLTACKNTVSNQEEENPKIVNIINFIRLLEPRDEKITEQVLYQTVANQVEMMKKYRLGGTFLLQYDALLDARYQNLLKSLPKDSFEIGGWWEIPQPLVENAGMNWRGRYPWDWHADVGFSTGYTPEEREKLVDVYMTDFKEIFGYYPKSVGSWFIDAHTLNYMYEKYGIIASCNCKDQIGTDGYTMWGGYWNQAYYPSKKNAYMPAQHESNQIPVPIFRMLGSDPVRQYDDGVGRERQGVISLEPVYPRAGGDEDWVNWYFNEFVSGECLGFAYVQAGQENSFTWNLMEKGLEIQMPLIARLRDEKKLKVETLAESGEWFKNNYQTTPATAVTINNDLRGSNQKTVWFNSRFYRLNLLWQDGTLRFRDIHLFDEEFASNYLTKPTTSNECHFFTLPFVDGNIWSSSEQIAGLYFKGMKNGQEVFLKGGDPEIKKSGHGKMQINWPLANFNATLTLAIDEEQCSVAVEGDDSFDWFLDFQVSGDADLPFVNFNSQKVDCEFEGVNYVVNATKGSFESGENERAFRILPKDNELTLQFIK